MELCVSLIGHHFSPPKRNVQLESIYRLKSYMGPWGPMAPRQAASWNNDLPVSAPLVFINKENREHLLLMRVLILAAPNKAFRFYTSGCAPDHQGVFVFGSL